MEENARYRVLWVDDDEDLIASFPTFVDERYHIDLDVAANWEDAEQLLRVHFREYSAIILDAYCMLKKSDKVPNKLFLGQVSTRLAMIFGEKQAFIPWYVLSAGTMEDFAIVLSIIETEERKQMDPLWGEMLYKKEANTRLEDSKNVAKLLKNIRKIAEEKTTNKVLLRHADVFKYLGKEEYVNYTEARTNILHMLSALYNPEENLGYQYKENPLRHVVEYIFRTANTFGLLPDDCYKAEDHLVLQESFNFLAGSAMRCFDSEKKGRVNYFKRFITGTDPVFSVQDANVLQGILDFSNSGSHTSKNETYIIEEDKKEIFFGYVLLLCHVIKNFGRYLESHGNRDANISSIEKIDIPNAGDEVVVKKGKDHKGNDVAFITPKCKLAPNYLNKEGKTFVLDSIMVNKYDDSILYPLFAKVSSPKAKNDIEKKKVKSETEKPKVEFVTQTPSIDSLRDYEGIIMLGGHKGEHAVVGAHCLLPPEYKNHVSQKIRILDLVDNPQKNDTNYSYLVTKAEFVDDKTMKKSIPDQDADAILAGISNNL